MSTKKVNIFDKPKNPDWGALAAATKNPIERIGLQSGSGGHNAPKYKTAEQVKAEREAAAAAAAAKAKAKPVQTGAPLKDRDSQDGLVKDWLQNPNG